MERAIGKVINKLYEVVVLSSHHILRGRPGNYGIAVVITFIPKEKNKITPDIVIVNCRYKLAEPDSSGERGLFVLESNVWVHDKNMPILTYLQDEESFREYCSFLFEKEAIKVANEIDPNWNKYESYN